LPDEEEHEHGGLENLANEALLVDTLMGWDGEPNRNLCGCWNAINPPHNLDLRGDPIHGTAGHARHANTIHGGCAICSPGSVATIESIVDQP
jgi:hypothetical protein